jgi:hypothetical protein
VSEETKLFFRIVEPLMFTDPVIGLIFNEKGERCGFIKRKVITLKELVEMYPTPEDSEDGKK